MLPRRPRDAAIDCAVVLLVHVMATLAFGPVFGSGVNYLIAGIGGAVLGVAVGVVTSLRPLRGWLQTAAGVVLAFVLFGPALAVRHATIGGVIPTLEGLQELLLGAVFAWKNLLTAQPPAEGFPSLLVVPMLTMLLCSTVATVLALRLTRAAAWAMVPGVVALVVAIAFGTKLDRVPVVLGAVIAAASVSWIAWRNAAWRHSLADEVEVTRDSANREAARRRRMLGAAAMITAATVVAGGASLPVAFNDRQILRDSVVPPVDLEAFPSPLSGFRSWYKNYEDATLLTVSGMPEDGRLRLATLDYFDGTVYAVAGSAQSATSGSFSRVGERIDSLQSGAATTVEVEVDQYSGVWVPSVGYAQSIAFEGDRAERLQSSLAYNGSTGSALSLAGMQPGDRYTIESLVPSVPDIDELEGVALSDVDVPAPAAMPDLIQAWVATNAVESTTFGNITHLSTLMKSGLFSHGLEGEVTSLSGHGLARLQEMFRADQLLGDDEQYAAAYALALTSLGVPARVVMGLYPDDGFGDSGEPVELTGGDMHAWVEVAFEGYGWVPLDPTPPEDNTPITQEPQPQPNPKPQVLQPPQPPEEPAEVQPNSQPEQGEHDEDEAQAGPWGVVLAVAGSILGVILLALLPFLIVWLFKRRRRKRRIGAETESARLAGGWHEVVDEAVDLGLPVPAGVTRREVAAAVAGRYPASRAAEIGEYVDEGVFGPGEPERSEIDAFWSDVDRSVRAMRHEATRRQRIRGALSIRSFLRRRQERRSTR